MSRSYVGCDYWPTVVANNVWSIFDYAVVVANAGSSTASVTITGPNGTSQTQTVAPNALGKFYLPWVPVLKGPDTDSLRLGDSHHLVGGGSGRGVPSRELGPGHRLAVQRARVRGQGRTGRQGHRRPARAASRAATRNSSNYGATIGCYSFSNDLVAPPSEHGAHGQLLASRPTPRETAPGPTGQPLQVHVELRRGSRRRSTRRTCGCLVSSQRRRSRGHGRHGDVPGGGELDLTLGRGRDVAELTSGPRRQVRPRRDARGRRPAGAGDRGRTVRPGAGDDARVRPPPRAVRSSPPRRSGRATSSRCRRDLRVFRSDMWCASSATSTGRRSPTSLRDRRAVPRPWPRGQATDCGITSRRTSR